jgi:hypothetical protein
MSRILLVDDDPLIEPFRPGELLIAVEDGLPAPRAEPIRPATMTGA